MEPFAIDPTLGPDSPLLRLAGWEAGGLTAGFTTRRGGVSRPPRDTLNTALHVGDDPDDAVANRKRVAALLGWPYEAWTCAEQVHGCRVQRVTGVHRGRGRDDRMTAIPDADALITDEPDVLLVLYFADCVPLYFVDEDTGALGLAHAGWKGTVLDVAGKTVAAMAEAFGTRPERLRAAIGPSIDGCCYEVDEAVLRHVRPLVAGLPAGSAEPEARPMIEQREGGRAGLNLKEINRHLMIKAGILPSRIEMSKWCTGCRTDLFFSHRKEKGATGRMMGWLGRKSG